VPAANGLWIVVQGAARGTLIVTASEPSPRVSRSDNTGARAEGRIELPTATCPDLSFAGKIAGSENTCTPVLASTLAPTVVRSLATMITAELEAVAQLSAGKLASARRSIAAAQRAGSGLGGAHAAKARGLDRDALALIASGRSKAASAKLRQAVTHGRAAWDLIPDALFHPAGSIPAAQYEIVPPAGDSDATPSIGRALNEQGGLAGFELNAAGLFQAFSWQGGTLTLVDVSDADQIVNAINPDGVIGGASCNFTGTPCTPGLFKKTSFTPLPTLGTEGPENQVYAMAGTVPVGVLQTPGGLVPVQWLNGKPVALAGLGGSARLYGANTQGTVFAGSSYLSHTTNVFHAFVYDPVAKRATDLGASAGGNSTARAVNRFGMVGGWSAPSGAEEAAVWWGAEGRLVGPAVGESTVLGLNDFGVGVGSTGPSNDSRAMLYAGGQAIDLNKLVPQEAKWLLLEARGINNRGEIVATGVRFGIGIVHALLLKPMRPA
jgi:uncharacterized membrane protein